MVAVASRASFSWLDPLATHTLNDLSEHNGTPKYRRLLRRELREQACSKSGRYGLRERCVNEASQMPFYIPPIDRPGLSTFRARASDSNRKDLLKKVANMAAEVLRWCLDGFGRLTSGPSSLDYVAILANLILILPSNLSTAFWLVTQSPAVTQPPSVTQPTSSRGLMDLPMEIREQIYGYILPVCVKDKFNAKGCDTYNPDIFTRQYETGLETLVYRNRGGKRSMAILRVNRRLHLEAEAYLLRGSTIRILVDESGYSMLEHAEGGFVLAGQKGSKSNRRFSSRKSGQTINYKPWDRFKKWHQSYIDRLDLTLPGKLVIKLEASRYDNPEFVYHIAESMMRLSETLRKRPRIDEIVVEPQMLEYRHARAGYLYKVDNNTAGSYFVWKCAALQPGLMRDLYLSRPAWRPRAESKRAPFTRTPVWHGQLGKTLLEKCPDIGFVLQPLTTLGNVLEASIKMPPATRPSAPWIVPNSNICAAMKGQGSFTIEREIERYQEMTEEAHEQMQTEDIQTKIKQARKLQARDLWYMWNAETPAEEFVACGEQGYDSDDELEWYKIYD